MQDTGRNSNKDSNMDNDMNNNANNNVNEQTLSEDKKLPRCTISLSDMKRPSTSRIKNG